VFKRAEYQAKAAEHSQLAETCQTEEVREVHRRLAEWFLLPADTAAMEPARKPSSNDVAAQDHAIPQ
jgi:hypothetical protein